MRWVPQHVDPLLALRDLPCNDRWSEGWDDIVTFQLQQQRQKRCQRALADQPAPAQPITFSALEAVRLLPTGDAPEDLSLS
jgi:hypothetical protein